MRLQKSCAIFYIFLIFMNMLVFDPIRAMSCDFLRVSQYFTISPKFYKKSEAVVRLVRRKSWAGEEQDQNKEQEK